MTYGFADVLDDGRVVVAPMGYPAVFFDGHSVPAPTSIMFLRAVLGPDGKAYACGQGHDDGRAWLIAEDGRSLDLGPTAGVSPVAMNVNGGRLIVAMQVDAESAVICEVEPVGELRLMASRSIPIQHTSQGFSDVTADGTPVLMDPIFRTIAGKLVGYVCQRWDLTLAQDNATGNPVLARGTAGGGYAIGTLAQGACFEPHLSPNGKYWICRSDSPTVFTGEVPLTLPPYIGPVVTPPPVPQPDPPPQPNPPPAQPTETTMHAEELDLRLCEIVNSSPQIVDFPITKLITKVDWKPGTSGEGLHFDFQPAMDWSETPIPGWNGGSLKFTIGVCLKINGKWYASAVIQTYGDGRFGAEPSRFAKAWLYNNRWGAMENYQPKTGEQFGLFVVAGNARDGALDQVVRARSNVVLIPFPSADGAVIDLDYSTQPPVPNPTPNPEPPPQPPAPPAQDVAALLAAFKADLYAKLDQEFKAQQEQMSALLMATAQLHDDANKLRDEASKRSYEGQGKAPILGTIRFTLTPKP